MESGGKGAVGSLQGPWGRSEETQACTPPPGCLGSLHTSKFLPPALQSVSQGYKGEGKAQEGCECLAQATRPSQQQCSNTQMPSNVGAWAAVPGWGKGISTSSPVGISLQQVRFPETRQNRKNVCRHRHRSLQPISSITQFPCLENTRRAGGSSLPRLRSW